MLQQQHHREHYKDPEEAALFAKLIIKPFQKIVILRPLSDGAVSRAVGRRTVECAVGRRASHG